MNIQLISNMYCNIIAVRVMKDIQRKNEAKQSSQKEVMSKSVILCKLSTTFGCNCRSFLAFFATLAVTFFSKISPLSV